MYYWEKEEITNQWTELYRGIPPIEGIDIAVPEAAIVVKVSYDPETARSDQSLRNFKRSTLPVDRTKTFINVMRIYPLASGNPIDSIEVACPDTLVHFPFDFRPESKGIRLMPKGSSTEVLVFVNSCRWIQRKFDKL